VQSSAALLPEVITSVNPMPQAYALQQPVDEIETRKGVNQICSVRSLGEIRWDSHLGSISVLVDMFNVVSSVLQNLAADSSAGAN
jgi:hypothetical protein